MSRKNTKNIITICATMIVKKKRRRRRRPGGDMMDLMDKVVEDMMMSCILRFDETDRNQDQRSKWEVGNIDKTIF